MENVHVIDIEIGNGDEVKKGALVFFNYVGTLDNGQEFDSTFYHGRPFEMVVGSKKVIQGMSLGLIGMRASGNRKIKIPAVLAYGERSIGDKIPANANLNFEIELLEVRNRES